MKAVVIAVRVSETTAAAVDAARGGQSRASWVTGLIAAALDGTEPVTAEKPAKATGGCPHPRARVIKGFCYRCGSMVGV